MIWRYDWQSEIGNLVMATDTDFAGCHQTRRSTSGGAALRGTHLIKSYSQTQSTICLSSAEAELGGIVKAASHGMGIQAMARDLGIDLTLELHADAAAAIGVCRRRGLGKIRHLHVADLWVQDKLKSQEFALTKIPGQENAADALTKHVDLRTLDKHLVKMSLQLKAGRAEKAPILQNNETNDEPMNAHE